MSDGHFPGAHLRPLFGVNYAPYPTDFVRWSQGGTYPPTGSDFFHDGFIQLWGSSGRNDLHFIRHNLKSNTLRLFNFKDYYNHATFLEAAAAEGLGVIVPLSNEALLFGGESFDPAAAWMAQVVQETRAFPANIAWGLTNELSDDPACNSIGGFAAALARVVRAAQLIDSLDPADNAGTARPIVISSIFDAGFATAKAVKAAFVAAGAEELFSRRVVNGLNLYFNEAPSLHQVIVNNVLTDYFADAELGQVPLIVTEYGRSSSAPFSPSSQADTIAQQAAAFRTAATGPAFPKLLGACVFVFSDAALEGTHQTFGLLQYGGSHTEVTGPSGGYRVDTWDSKPAAPALLKALS